MRDHTFVYRFINFAGLCSNRFASHQLSGATKKPGGTWRFCPIVKAPANTAVRYPGDLIKLTTESEPFVIINNADNRNSPIAPQCFLQKTRA